MERYIFVYSVDAVTTDGRMESYGMILDHPDLAETIGGVSGSGGTVQAVTVAMYDSHGMFISERDVTHMCVPCQ